MTADTPPDGEGGDDRIRVTATWDGSLWAVSMPNPRQPGRAHTGAVTLAEVVPNAARVLRALIDPLPPTAAVERVTSDLAARIDVWWYIDADVFDRYRNARSPFEAGQVLRHAGLRDDDISEIVRSRITAFYSGVSDDPWITPR